MTGEPARRTGGAEGVAAAVHELLGYVVMLPTAAAQDAMLVRIAERLPVSIASLRQDLQRRLPDNDPRRVQPASAAVVKAIQLLRTALVGLRDGLTSATTMSCIEYALEELQADQAGGLRDAA